MSAVWAEFVQCLLLFAGGIIVTAFGLVRVGGLGPLLREFPEKFYMVYPTSHHDFPFAGMVGTILSVGVWYVCTNQFMVQRCLGARSEWDARMGGITAGYYKLILPIIICLPGIIAYKVLGPQVDPNHVYALLIATLIPVGLIGLIMAGLAAAIMSTISSAMNAASTILTMDLYRPLLLKNISEKKLVLFGRLACVVMMIIAIIAAFYFSEKRGQVFLVIQNIFCYFAAPVAVLFIMGIFWKGGTSTAATTTFISGFALNEIVQRIVFKIAPFSQYNSFYNRATVVFFLSFIIFFIVSLFTRKTAPAIVNDICWRPSDMKLRGDGRSPHGTKSLVIFWFFMVVSILSVYATLFYFQFTHR
jgi:SSS family solute:Na+ symporter